MNPDAKLQMKVGCSFGDSEPSHGDLFDEQQIDVGYLSDDGLVGAESVSSDISSDKTESVARLRAGGSE